MKRISTATAVANKFGAGKNGFTNGSVVGGVPATDLEADWFDGMQEEVANVIEDLGLPLDPENRKQLLGALRGRLLAQRVFTTTTLYVPTPGTKFVRVRLAGGGGAGGGAVVTGVNAVSGGSGGGSGAYVESILATGFANQLVVIGAAGAVVPGASGGDGGGSSFAGLIAQGGNGGKTYGPGSVPLSAGFANPANASGGTLNVPGQSGSPLLVINQSVGLGGVGANGIWGNGGGSSNGGDNGAGGAGYGSGGGGALSFQNNNVVRIGGPGGPGLAIIEEFA